MITKSSHFELLNDTQKLAIELMELEGEPQTQQKEDKSLPIFLASGDEANTYLWEGLVFKFIKYNELWPTLEDRRPLIAKEAEIHLYVSEHSDLVPKLYAYTEDFLVMEYIPSYYYPKTEKDTGEFLVKFFKQMNELGVRVNDLHEQNLLYSRDLGYRVIDLGAWQFDPNVVQENPEHCAKRCLDSLNDLGYAYYYESSPKYFQEAR